AIGGDVESGERAGEGFGDDQRLVVGGDDHAIGEGDAVCHLPNRSIRRDQRDDAGAELLLAELEADAVHVNVGSAVHDDFVPAVAGEAAQVGVGDQRPV